MNRKLILLIFCSLLFGFAAGAQGQAVDVNDLISMGVLIFSDMPHSSEQGSAYGCLCTGNDVGYPAGARPVMWWWPLYGVQDYEVNSPAVNLMVHAHYGSEGNVRLNIVLPSDPWVESVVTWDNYVGDQDWLVVFNRTGTGSIIGQLIKTPATPPPSGVWGSVNLWFYGTLPPELVQNWLDHPGSNNGIALVRRPGYPMNACLGAQAGEWWGQGTGPRIVFNANRVPDKAKQAIPQSGSKDVPACELVLKWAFGDWVEAHNVYFGTKWDDVNDATTTVDPNNVYQGQLSTIYDQWPTGANTLDLEWNKTYYWRVDEVNVTDHVPFKGTVWYFTTSSGKASIPVPRDGRVEVDPPVMLSWTPGVYATDTAGHDVYFGRSETDVTNATPSNPLDVYVGRQTDPCLPFATLTPDVNYYWRIDEVNENPPCGDPCIIGDVWMFRTRGSGPAMWPSPANGVSVPDLRTVMLEWRPGDWIRDTAGHEIYFGTDWDEVNDADRTLHPNVNYAVSDVNEWDPKPLEFSMTYFWRVDEVNDPCDSNLIWKGPVWNFSTLDYITLDDFPYADTNDMLLTWEDGDTYIPACTAGWSTGSDITLSGGTMVYDYNNNGLISGRYNYSEIRRYWPGGTDFTEGSQTIDCAALYIEYYGAADNNNDPVYDRMYVILEDTAGVVAQVDHADPNAQRAIGFNQWDIALSEFIDANNVDVTAVKYMYIGFGQRCNSIFSGMTGGPGTVTFDNFRLYPTRCVPSEGPPYDLTDDCVVGLEDVAIIAGDWLATDSNIVNENIQEPCDPVLWYLFDDGSGGNADDATVHDYNGTLHDTDSGWYASGGYDNSGYLYLDGITQNVSIPAGVWVENIDEDVSISVWVKVNRGDFPQLDTWVRFLNLQDTNGLFEIYLPTPRPPLFESGPAVHFRFDNHTGGDMSDDDIAQCYNVTESDFAGQWHHYAFVKEGTTDIMAIYHNGFELCPGPNEAEANNVGAIFDDPVVITSLGSAHPDIGGWAGGVDDLRIYDYPLSADEIAYIATNGTGEFDLPLNTPADLYISDPNIIDFKDYAVLSNTWLDRQLWP